MTEGNNQTQQQPIYFNEQPPSAPTDELSTNQPEQEPIYFNEQPKTQTQTQQQTYQQQIPSDIPQDSTPIETEIKIQEPNNNNNNNNNNDPSQPLLTNNNNDSVFGPKDGDGCCKSSHACSWIFTILFWVFIVLQIISLAGILEGGTWIIALIGITYIIQLIETCCSSTTKYLSNIYLKEECAQYINTLETTPPQIIWKISCYHYETVRKRVTTTDANGNKTTRWETHREKRYTYHANIDYNYNNWKDISMPLFDKLEEYKLTQVTLIKRFEFANTATQNHYNLTKNAFILQNNRDMHYDFYETMELNNWKDKLLAESAPGVKPGWINIGFFYFCSLIGLSPCYRNAFTSKCGSKKHHVVKQIAC